MSSSAKDRFLRLQSLLRSGAFEQTAKAAQAALRVSPKDPNLLHLAAQAAEGMNDMPRAKALYTRALEAHPGWIEATFNLARVTHTLGDSAEAIALMTKVAAQKPDFPLAHEALARFHQSADRLPEALRHWEKALSLAPEAQEWRAQYLLLLRQLCDWREAPQDIETLPPQAITVLCDDPAAQMAAAQRYAAQKFGKIAPLPSPAWPRHERVRIGYLSSDFHEHATAYLLAELFDLHDRARFEVFAYSYGVDDKSPMRQRLRNGAEHFIELNAFTASQAATRIREDEIDILIDLKGYTRGSRLEILAYRPAPVQLHWLGYPGTLGAPFVDGFIADDVTIPPGDEKFFTETVLRLPDCYQINDRQRRIGQPLTRRDYGLPDTGFVFASFNQTYKITPVMFALWCDILRDAQGSVLWLYESNPYAPNNLRRAAQGHGIDPARLVFAKPLPLAKHLARYAHVGLCLDTHPVGGHTTTSDALWAGAPVLTMPGHSFVSRVAASILTAANCPEMIANTPKKYHQLALAGPNNANFLPSIRAKLASQPLKLFDSPRFVLNLETALLSTDLRTYPQS